MFVFVGVPMAVRVLVLVLMLMLMVVTRDDGRLARRAGGSRWGWTVGSEHARDCAFDEGLQELSQHFLLGLPLTNVASGAGGR